MAHKGSGLIKAAFDTDNFLMRFCEKVLDIVTVNLLFVVSCLPIVTIGVAKISLYQTIFEVKSSRRVPVFKTYMRAFKQNLKLGLQLGLLELGIFLISVVDLSLFWGQTSLGFQFIKAICLGILIFLTLVMLASYPIAARYDLTWKEVLQKGLLLVSFNFVWFFLMLAIILLIMMLLYLSGFTLVLGGSAFLLFGFGLLAFCQAGLMEKLFAKYQAD
ncbi:YesL family protein [Streptococcus sp. BJSWXB6CM1]|uniref:YesL family protein n=1 Tax=Streptococcus fermentans TaxID=3095082 RepID=A0ABU5FW74_9STRE|nr:MULTISPECIES: YesL family protein [unclassified Streptococcus]MDY4346014.1 YesL family protein [Streptococcus sp. BJSWXB5TM5]MDY4361515.1 YesL family protein [Streptococcus sp. BJSWXB3CM3]MDY4371673.1 YesL family protein [Streptococcus sp. BJSWXB6CM1]